MGKYRKKPVVIEAVQFDESPSSAQSVTEFAGKWAQPHADGSLTIHTLEGPLTAAVGDWIIRGVKGEFYPCKPDIFAATYEPADAHASEVPPVTEFQDWPDVQRQQAVALDQITAERDHLLADMKHMRAELDRLRARDASAVPPVTMEDEPQVLPE